MPGRHGEGPHVIHPARFARRDEVREGPIRLLLALVRLLPQRVEGREQARARLVGVDLDVVATLFAGKKP